jgi:hypothetical protein
MSLQDPLLAPGTPVESAAVVPSPRRDERLLEVRLQRELTSQACLGLPTTYRRLRGRLSLPELPETSPLRTPLEDLMEEDAAAGRPFIASLAVNARGGGLPAPWFFRKAEGLGRFAGAAGDAVETFAFHAKELRRAGLITGANREPTDVARPRLRTAATAEEMHECC